MFLKKIVFFIEKIEEKQLLFIYSLVNAYLKFFILQCKKFQ
jgi:hypothetical protein